jgi:hypothetical protein
MLYLLLWVLCHDPATHDCSGTTIYIDTYIYKSSERELYMMIVCFFNFTLKDKSLSITQCVIRAQKSLKGGNSAPPGWENNGHRGLLSQCLSVVLLFHELTVLISNRSSNFRWVSALRLFVHPTNCWENCLKAHCDRGPGVQAITIWHLTLSLWHGPFGRRDRYPLREHLP